jgi:hypothetical protein
MSKELLYSHMSHCQKVAEYLLLLKSIDHKATSAAIMVIGNPIHVYLGCHLTPSEVRVHVHVT